MTATNKQKLHLWDIAPCKGNLIFFNLPLQGDMAALPLYRRAASLCAELL